MGTDVTFINMFYLNTHIHVIVIYMETLDENVTVGNSGFSRPAEKLAKSFNAFWEWIFLGWMGTLSDKGTLPILFLLPFSLRSALRGQTLLL